MHLIKITSAPAGAGKTTALCHHIIHHVRTEHNVCFVQPTKELIDKTAAQILEQDPHIITKVVHSGTADHVVRDLVRYLKQPIPEPHVLFITWAAFERLPYFHGRRSWHLIVDEVPSVVRFDNLSAPDSHSVLTNHLRTHAIGPVYSLLLPSNRSKIRTVAESSDVGYKPFVPLARVLRSPHYASYVKDANYRSLLAGRGAGRKLQVHSTLNPSIVKGFATVTMAGARFSESLLFQLWGKQGVTFEEDLNLGAKLRFAQHKNGHLITIDFAFDEDWSKRARDREDRIRFREFAAEALDWVASEPALWMANADISEDLFASKLNVKRLPNAPHGLNAFQQYHRVVVFSALNPQPAEFSFLSFKGIDRDGVLDATGRYAIYQALMRSSARNPLDTNPKRFLVPDRRTAEWLETVFPGASIKGPLVDVSAKTAPAAVGRPRKHSNDAERK